MAEIAVILLLIGFGFFVATAPQEFIQIVLMISWALMLVGGLWPFVSLLF